MAITRRWQSGFDGAGQEHDGGIQNVDLLASSQNCWRKFDDKNNSKLGDING